MSEERSYWTRRPTRRQLLGGVAIGGLGASAWALVGCGSSGNNAAASPTANASQGPNSASTVTPKRGGQLTVGWETDPTSLDPATGTSGLDQTAFWLFADNLVGINQQGNPDANYSLATSWEIPDPLTLTFHLRPNVSFHDGTPFNADAAVFNLQRVLTGKDTGSAKANLTSVATVTATDPQTVKITLTSPNASLLSGLADRAGAMMAPAAISKGNTGTNPVGTGPFTFVEWQKGSLISGVANRKYWRAGADGSPLPYLDKITLNIRTDGVVRAAGLQNGESDYARIGAADWPTITGAKGLQNRVFPGASWQGPIFNLALPPMDDPNFRMALAYSVDKNAVVQSSQFGLAQAGIGPLTPAHPQWNPKIAPIGYDPAKAKQLLAASKYANNPKFNMFGISGMQSYAADGLLYQAMWKNIGITANQDTGDIGRLGEFLTQGKYQASPLGIQYRLDPDIFLSLAFATAGTDNPGHVPNNDIDALLQKGRETYDANQRQLIYDDAQTKIIAAVMSIFTYYTSVLIAASQSVGGFKDIMFADIRERFTEAYRLS